MKLSQKNCLVTGGSRGIGRAIALGLASEGANVAIIYKSNKSEALNVVSQIKSTYGVKAIPLQADVSSNNDIQRIVSEFESELGAIDILVNNAGIVYRTPFTDVSEDEFLNSIGVNLKGPFFLTQAVSKLMIKHGISGSIIMISSISSNKASPNISTYECAKAGVSMLTKSAALALAPYDIRVNAISPGLTATDMTQPSDDPLAKPLSERSKELLLNRVGVPKDHVGAAIFLACRESSWMTGTEIIIDGGESVR